MKQGLFVERGPFETRVALIERDRVVEVHLEPAGSQPVAGAIWLGRVTDLMPAMQAAAVDLGQGVTGFLRAADARVLDASSGEKRPPLKKLLRRGQAVLVQAVRRAADGKQIRLTADIALHGRYVSLYPLRQGIDIAKRIGDPDQRESLQGVLEKLAIAGRVVARPVSVRVESDLVQAEAERLSATWQKISEAQATIPALLRDAPSLLHRALTEIAPPSPEMVAVSDRSVAADLHGLSSLHAPDLQPLIGLAASAEGLELDHVLDDAVATQVALPGGGMISIEATRAVTAIDIDSAGSRGTPVDLNMRAIAEIAYHLRLRRIGGPVVIDFISMKAGNERKRVEAALRRAFERDPVMVDVGQVDRFSLGTLIRGREESGLSHQLLAKRPVAPMLQRNVIASRVLRKIAAELDGIGPLPMSLHLSSDLKPLFDEGVMAETRSFLGRPVTLAFDERASDSYSIERQR